MQDNPDLMQPQSKVRLNHMAMLIDNVSDAIFSFNKKKIILFWNKGAERTYGWTAEEAMGQDAAVLLRTESSEAKRDQLLSETEKAGDLLVEAIHYTKDGKRIYVESHVLAIKNKHGEVTGYSVVNRDITERKIAEEKLRTSEERFRIVQELSVDGFTLFKPVFDCQGNIIDFIFLYENPAVAKMNGTTPEAVIGRKLLDLFPGHESTQFYKTYKKVYETGIPMEFEDHYKGETILTDKWFRIVTVPTSDGIAVLAQDISERRIHEMQLQEAFLEIKESEERLRDSQELAHVGSFDLDIRTGKIKWSDETYNLYELPRNTVLTFDSITSYFHPDDRPWIAEAIKDGMENNHLIKFQCRLQLANGKLKYIGYNGRPVYDSNGKPIRRVGAVTDITEMKLQELELRKTLNDLRRSNKELEEFAYVASHDLQEPLRMISTYTRMLEIYLQNKMDEKTSQFMFFITDGAKRMHTLIRDLLAYSRVSSMDEALVPTDLNAVIAEVLRDLQIAITEHKAEIIYDNLPTVNAHSAQIKLVFQNLIQNSIKFRGKDAPVIQINAERNNHEWKLKIKDNGIGIDKGSFDRIFVLFQRLHEKDKYPGTGIGLSICKKIVERHGGQIWLEAEPGKGSTFFFTVRAN